jgi:hypothetical protein
VREGDELKRKKERKKKERKWGIWGRGTNWKGKKKKWGICVREGDELEKEKRKKERKKERKKKGRGYVGGGGKKVVRGWWEKKKKKEIFYGNSEGGEWNEKTHLAKKIEETSVNALTHTKLRWPININNSITATQHF